jgi:hypothetical protein
MIPPVGRTGEKMRPLIDNTSFGSITIDNTAYKYDIIIRVNGQVEKRKKELSEKVHGSSHTVSLEEIRDLYDHDVELLIVGTGQYQVLKLSAEADEFLAKNNCRVQLLATPKAIAAWNQTKVSKVIALFHVTC